MPADRSSERAAEKGRDYSTMDALGEAGLAVVMFGLGLWLGVSL